MFDWDVARGARHHDRQEGSRYPQGLFDDFEKAETAATKEKIIAKVVEELKIHAVIGEEIFYTTVRAHVGNKLMNEADEEHHVAKVLIAELDAGDRNAKSIRS